MNKLSQLYDSNYQTWAKQTIELLETRRFAELDIEHLIIELSDMGKSEQRELINRLRILLSHLLKWQYQYKQLSEKWREFDGKSWKNTIIAQRIEIAIQIRKQPSLKSLLSLAITEAYSDAVELTMAETGLSISTFPAECLYTEMQILDKQFFPQSE